MKNFKVLVVIGKEKFKVELSLKIDENVFYKECQLMETLKDMLRFQFSGDPTYLYKYIKTYKID